MSTVKQITIGVEQQATAEAIPASPVKIRKRITASPVKVRKRITA